MTVTHRVGMIGLGPMGTALARALIVADVPTVVWNRTAARSVVLEAQGAVVAATPADLARAVDLVIVCVRDHHAANAILNDLDPADLAGRTVVNLSSATPDDARRTASHARERGIDYLTGAIMVPTPLAGAPEALILYSGDRDLFDRHVDRLRVLAGVADHLGADHGLAALYDVAMLEVFFTAITAFLHGAAMTTAHGVSATDLLPYATSMVGLLPATFAQFARDVDAGTYPGDEDTISMNLSALEHIEQASSDAGIDARIPALLRDLGRSGVESGYGADGWARIVDVIRAGAPPVTTPHTADMRASGANMRA